MIFFLFIIESTFLFIGANNTEKLKFKENDKNKFMIKLLPAGIYFIEIINYSYNSLYDEWLYKSYLKLKGFKNVDLYRKIHLAEKIIFLHIIILLFSLVEVFYKLSIEICCLGFILALIAIIGNDMELKKELNRQKNEILLDFSEFVNKLSILVGTGLTLSSAWVYISKKLDKERFFNKQVILVTNEMRSGKSFVQSLEVLSLRCQTFIVSKFVSIIIQNILKGNKDIVLLLDQLTYDEFNNRKKQVQIKAERINSKLVFPMMINLVAIFLIMVIPAVLMIIRLI